METMARKSTFSPEVRERAVGLVRETRQSHDSEWAAITSVAEKMGCTPETLRKWMRQAQRDAGTRPGPTTEDKARIKELEREVHELRRTNDILRKASAFFAQAELDRRPR
jgi:transposase-like protein